MDQNQLPIDWDKILESLEKDESQGKILTDEEQQLLQELKSLKKDAYQLLDGYQNFDTLKELEQVKTRIAEESKPKKTVRLWPKIATTAAAIVAIVCGVIWYTTFPTIHPQNQQTNISQIAPGKNKATITLENGKTINLSENETGVVIASAGLKYNDGSVVNELEKDNSNFDESIQTLTTTTPKGGTYQITLPDGTKVWLNAASRISFPSRFTGTERKVDLLGEAYFEVAKDKLHKFLVNSRNQQIFVLGTHFNVTAYPEDLEIKTTLLEGSVKINNKNGQTALLKPGEQAQVYPTKINITTAIDIEDAVAWKNGYFKFNESLESIMAKVSRWYNVEVVYDPKLDKTQSFSGKILRSRNITSIFKIMELTGKVKFKIEGRRVTVMN